MLFVEHVRWISGWGGGVALLWLVDESSKSMSRAVNLWVEGRAVSHYSLDVAEEEEEEEETSGRRERPAERQLGDFSVSP